jgi:enoyl-CoA hydratase
MTEEKAFVIAERLGAIYRLTLTHAEVSNALHPKLVAQLSRFLTNAADDEGINVVILTGAGKSFCAGLDLGLLMELGGEEKNQYLRSVTRLFEQIWMLPQPVIAAVNGAAIAGGFDLAAFCDIRLASREARFGQAEINLGLTQIIHPLYKTIGLARAKELALTGETISGEEAYRIGLVNHLYDGNELMDKAMEMGALLAAKPRFALLETKRLTRELIDLDTQAALAEIHKSLQLCFASDDHKQRVAKIYARLKNR